MSHVRRSDAANLNGAERVKFYFASYFISCHNISFKSLITKFFFEESEKNAQSLLHQKKIPVYSIEWFEVCYNYCESCSHVTTRN